MDEHCDNGVNRSCAASRPALQSRRTRRGSQLIRRASQDTGGVNPGSSPERQQQHEQQLQQQHVLHGAGNADAGGGGGGGGGIGDAGTGGGGRLVSAAHDMTSVFGLEVN